MTSPTIMPGEPLFGDRRGRPNSDIDTVPGRTAADMLREQELASHPLGVPSWIPRAIYLFVAFVTIVLLVLHTFKVSGTEVDTTTLGLLTLLLLLPLAPYIRRLRAGDFEAEIGPREAQQLQARAGDLPPAAIPPSGSMTDAPTVQELIARDPPLGLAKLRIELEREIRDLYMKLFPDASPRGLTLGVITRDLRERGSLPPDIAAPLADVTALANRAVHGQYVAPDVAEEIADVGLRVLNALQLENARTASPDARMPAG